MKSIDGLLNTIKQRHNITSDYKLALFLGMGEGNIANYRHKRSMPNAEACAKIAKALDMDPDVLTVHFEALRAKDEETRKIWERILRRLESGAVHVAVLVAVCLAGFTSTPNAEASTLSADASKGGRLYIMLS